MCRYTNEAPEIWVCIANGIEFVERIFENPQSEERAYNI